MSAGGRRFVLATRPSPLARRQTATVQRALAAAWSDLNVEVLVITTQGDRVLDRPLPEIGGKGLFTQELEAALRDSRADLAVHSLKDLPIEAPPGLRLGAILRREDARDVLVAPLARGLDDLPPGARVGTSSLRRQAQLLALRPDLRLEPMRGNIGTRLRRVHEGACEAAILAGAGLVRLGLQAHIAAWLPMEAMLPAPGQGALAVQCREDDRKMLELLAPLDDPDTRAEVAAERAFLAGLGGGCAAPVGAYALKESGRLRLSALVASADGREVIRVEDVGDDPERLGLLLAERALARGAAEVMQHA